MQCSNEVKLIQSQTNEHKHKYLEKLYEFISHNVLATCLRQKFLILR